MRGMTLPRGRQQDIVTQELAGELLIYDLKTNKAISLNKTAAVIWNECDGNKSVSEISRIVNQKLNARADESLVWLAIDGFRKENLLANSEAIETETSGMSRREVIKKVGLGSMVALPLIVSVIAPTAAMAQSACVPVGESCVAPEGGFLSCCGNDPNIICCGPPESAFCIDILLSGGDCGATN